MYAAIIAIVGYGIYYIVKRAVQRTSCARPR
jgi:hypothetical protein